MSIQITCIKKSGGFHADPHHAIESLGWLNEQTGATGISGRIEIYDWLKNRGGVACVRDARGNVANVGPREHSNGVKFVQTYADKTWTDNLLALLECR
jgi:hypothetical protein